MKILKEDVWNTFSSKDISNRIGEIINNRCFGRPVADCSPDVQRVLIDFIKNNSEFNWDGYTDDELIEETYAIFFDDSLIKREGMRQFVLSELAYHMSCPNQYGPVNVNGFTVYILQQ